MPPKKASVKKSTSSEDCNTKSCVAVSIQAAKKGGISHHTFENPVESMELVTFKTKYPEDSGKKDRISYQLKGEANGFVYVRKISKDAADEFKKTSIAKKTVDKEGKVSKKSSALKECKEQYVECKEKAKAKKSSKAKKSKGSPKLKKSKKSTVEEKEEEIEEEEIEEEQEEEQEGQEPLEEEEELEIIEEKPKEKKKPKAKSKSKSKKAKAKSSSNPKKPKKTKT